MKVYLSIMKGFEGDLIRPSIEKLVLGKGHEITESYELADLILKHVRREDAELYANREKTTLFYVADDGKPRFLKNKSSKMVPLSIKLDKTTEMEYQETQLSCGAEAKLIFHYLAGKLNACNVNRVMQVETLSILYKIANTMTSHSKFVEKKKIEYINKTGLELEDLIRASNLIIGTTQYEQNKFTRLLRKVPYFYYTTEKKMLPNISDNVFVNLLSICRFKIYIENVKDETKIPGFEEKIKEDYNSILVTIKESLTGSSAFKKYAKRDARQLGVYSLFICDNSLENDEIMIPHPNNVGVSRKNYPKIGDYIIDARHPITTVITKVKVKGYTDDCSIRVNSYIALCEYGDADGDAHSISWSSFANSLKWDEVKEIDSFAKVAGIKLEDSSFQFTQAMWNELQQAKLPSEDECLLKSSASGLEQAEAKLVTKSVTGTFGSIERDVAQTLIVNKKAPTMEMLHRKSWLSQIPVQAKNLLADLRSGKELDQLTKETLKLYCEMQEAEVDARTGIKQLLGLDNKGAIQVINDIYGRENKVKIDKTTDETDVLKKLASVF